MLQRQDFGTSQCRRTVMPAQTGIRGFLENTGKYSTWQAPPKHRPKKRFLFVLGKLRFINNSSSGQY
jgi:hypothetical protein